MKNLTETTEVASGMAGIWILDSKLPSPGDLPESELEPGPPKSVDLNSDEKREHKGRT